MTYQIRMAKDEDADLILNLYHSLVGTKGCTWNLAYPGMEEIERDISENSLYVMCGESDEIIGAAFAGNDADIDEITCWNPCFQKPCVLARIGISPNHQNQGLARKLLTYIESNVVARGFDSLCFLVSKTNSAALNLYDGMRYHNVGEAFMFDIDFYCYEKQLTGGAVGLHG